MRIESKNDELRWKVVRAMLDEFPELREKAQEYLERQAARRLTG